MKSRIIKVIAIVLGGVTAFTLAVFGVMALMGKFKTPIVEPETLAFTIENTELIKNSDNSNKPYNGSFVLTGTSTSEHEVNQTKCYISFVSGNELLTLCDVNGKPLTMDEFHNYTVDCNKPIYYKLTEPADGYYETENYGEVILRARDKKGKVETEQNLVITIDKSVDKLKLDNTSNSNIDDISTTNKKTTQNAKCGVETEIYFDITSTNKYALKPIYNKDAKNIEIYYHSDNGLIRVERDNNNTIIFRRDNDSVDNSINNNFLFYSEDKSQYYLKPTLSNYKTSYTFTIACFKTYAEEKAYLENTGNLDNTYYERLQSMTSTELTINVYNSDITEVEILNPVNLNLYYDTNITIDDNVLDSTNIALRMYREGNKAIDRLNEIGFNLITDSVWETDSVLFKDKDGNSIDLTNHTITENNGNYIINGEYKVVLENVSIDNKTLIKQIETTGDKTTIYTSAKNAVFLDTTTNKLAVLRNGSYLDFYTKANNVYSLDNSFAEITKGEGVGTRSTFKILAKEIKDNLNIGILVVNANGGYCFATNEARVTEVELNADFTGKVVNGKTTLTISYNEETTYYDEDYNIVSSDTEGAQSSNYKIIAGSEEFKNLITLSGSYNAGVFVTEQADSYPFKVCSDFTITTGEGENAKTYVLVGYFDDDGNFVNAIQLNNNVENGTSKRVYLLQLKNKYEQTAESFIEDLLNQSSTGDVETAQAEDTTPNLSELIRDLHIDKYIDVVVNYDISKIANEDITTSLSEKDNAYLNKDEINNIYTIIKYDNYSYKYSITSSDYVVKQMLKNNLLTKDLLKINLYNKDNSSSFIEQNNSVLTFEGIGSDDNANGVKIEFKVNEYTDNLVEIVYPLAGREIKSNKIKIKTTDAENIVYITKTNDTEINSNKKYYKLNNGVYELENTPTKNNIASYYEIIDIEEASIKVVIGYDSENEEYTYTYYWVVDKVETLIGTSLTLNGTSDANTTTGFVALVDGVALEGVTQNIAYVSNSDKIFTIETDAININKIGKGTLTISSGTGVNKFIDVPFNVEANSFSLTVKTNHKTTGTNEIALTSGDSGDVNYTYNGTSIPLKLLELELDSYTYGKSGLLYLEGTSIKYSPTNVKNDSDEKILEITDNATFTRVNDLVSSLVLTFKLKAKTLSDNESITLSYSPAVTIDENSMWGDVFYQGTTIVIAEEDIGNDFKNEAVYKITNNSITSGYTGVTISVNYGEKEITGDENIKQTTGNSIYTTLKLNDIGVYKISFILNDTILATKQIEVIPNVLVGAGKEVTSDTKDLTIGDLVTLQKYQTASYTYGLTTGNTTPLYTDDNTTGLEDFTNITITTKSESLISTNGGVSIGWLNSINTPKKENIKIYANRVEVGTATVTIKNKYSVAVNNNNTGIYTEGTKTFNIMANTEYASLFTVTGFSLTSIQLFDENGAEIENVSVLADGKFTIPNIQKPLKNAWMRLTFTDNGNTLTYETKGNYIINIESYRPALNDDIEAVTNVEFDLLKDIFNTIDIDKITKIVLTSVESGYFTKDNQDFIVINNEVTIYDGNISGYVVTVGGITTESATTTIKYKLYYTDGRYGEFEYELTITNTQVITTDYPYFDLTTTTNLAFLNETDARNILGDNITNNNGFVVGTVPKAIENYETLTIGQKIDFINHDTTLNITRASGTNINLARISIVGCSNSNAFRNYISNANNYTISGTSLTFNQSATLGAGASGIIIVKLESETGYVAYYYVKLFNQYGTNYESVNRENINLQAGENFKPTENAILNETDKTIFGVEYCSNFASKFGLTLGNETTFANNLKFYYINATTLRDNESISVNINDSTVVKHSLLNSDMTIGASVNYIHFTVAIIYSGTDAEFYLGTATFYIQPDNKESVNSNLEDLKDCITFDTTTIKSGEYTYTQTGSADFENPFEYKVNDILQTPAITFKNVSDGYAVDENNQIVINNETDPIISLDTNNTTIKFNKYVEDDLYFDAVYTYDNGFVLIIHFVYEALKVDLSTDTQNIGSATQFASEFKLFKLKEYIDSIAPGYSGSVLFKGVDAKISLTGAQGSDTDTGITNVKYNYDSNGELVLKFTQTNEYQNIPFDITFDALTQSNKTKTINFVVASGITTTNENAYSNASNALSSTEKDTTYSNNVGSSITIDTTTTNTYKIGTESNQLTIATVAGSLLEITAPIEYIKYFIGATNNSTYAIINLVDGKIQFAHNCKINVKIPLTIKIKDSTAKYYKDAENKDISITVYVSPAVTYYGLSAIYSLNGASYETVKTNTKILNLQNYLFNPGQTEATTYKDGTTYYDANGNRIESIVNENTFNAYTGKKYISDVINLRRVGLIKSIKANGEINEITTDYNPEVIGLFDSTNINYLDLKVSNADYATSSKTLTFTKTGDVNVVNDNGVNDFTYKFEVIATDYVAVYDTNVDYIHKNEDTTTRNYISINIYDNKSTYQLNGDINGDNGLAIAKFNSVNILKINSISYKIDENETVSLPLNDNSYTITNTNSKTLTFTILLKDTGELVVNLVRQEGFDKFDTLAFSIDAYTNFATIDNNNNIQTIAGETFKYDIVFNNYKLYSNASAQEVLGGSSINLATQTEEIGLKDKDGTQISLTDSSFSISMIKNESYYVIGGKRYSMETNTILTYNNDSKIVVFKAVGVPVTGSLKLQVSKNGYIVGYLNYQFEIMPNYRFVINDNTISNTNNAYDIFYMLTTRNLDTSTYKEDLLNEQSDTYNKVSYEYNNKTNEYYTDIWLKLQNVAGGDIDSSKLNISITKVEGYDKVPSTFKIENNSLVLPKDYTGKITLLLEVNEGANGIYKLNVNIYVVGFISLNYTSENAVLYKSAPTGFAPGESVNIIDSTSGRDVGLVMSNTNSVQYKENDANKGSIHQNADWTITPIVQYKVITMAEYEISDRDLKTIFDSVGITYSGATLSTSNNKMTITLPQVKQDSTITDYVVVYQINLSCLGLTNGPYYVAYCVSVTEQQIAPVESQKTIYDTDNIITNVGVIYYKEIVTYNGLNVIEIYLSADKEITLKVLEGSTDLGLTKDDTYTSTDGINFGQIEITDANETKTTYPKIIINRDNNTITINSDTTEGLKETTKNITITKEYNKDKSYLFNCKYKNIMEFKSLVDSITSVKLSNMSGFIDGSEECYYDLTADTTVENTTGGFYISLLNPYSDISCNNSITLTNNILFVNELNAKLSLIGDGEIVSIDSFTVTTTNKITPNGKYKLSDIFLSNQYDSNTYADCEVIGVFKDLNATAGTKTSASVDDAPKVSINTWINNASATAEFVNLGTETNPNYLVTIINVDGVIYTLYKVKFSAEDGHYKIEDYFYVLGSATGNIVTVNYAYGGQYDFISVSNSLSIDISKYLVEYIMKDNKIFTKQSATGTIELDTEGTNNDNKDVTLNNGVLTLNANNYEVDTSNTKSITKTYALTCGEVKITIKIIYTGVKEKSPTTPTT